MTARVSKKKKKKKPQPYNRVRGRIIELTGLHGTVRKEEHLKQWAFPQRAPHTLMIPGSMEPKGGAWKKKCPQWMELTQRQHR